MVPFVLEGCGEDSMEADKEEGSGPTQLDRGQGQLLMRPRVNVVQSRVIKPFVYRGFWLDGEFVICREQVSRESVVTRYRSTRVVQLTNRDVKTIPADTVGRIQVVQRASTGRKGQFVWYQDMWKLAVAMMNTGK